METDKELLEKAAKAFGQNIVAQPEQEPVAVVTGVYGGRFTYAPFKSTVVLPVGAALYLAPPQRTEQNFCQRCGKRTKDLTHIHTCTPPQEKST